MNILMLNYEFPPVGGGAANANLEIIRHLSGHKDLKIDIVTSSEGRQRIDRLFGNVAVHRLSIGKKSLHYWTLQEISKFMAKAFFYSIHLSKKKEYDIWHSFSALPQGIIPFMLGKRYILSLRGSDVPGFNPRLKAFSLPQTLVSKIIWSHAQKVVANSQGLRLLANRTSDLQISVIPNGVDTEMFSPGKPEGRLILCVSRLIPRKRLDTLVKAMPLILRRYGDAKLIIAGDGPEKEHLEKLVRSFDITDHVSLLGYVSHEDLPGLYRKAYVFILPSLYEGMSNTVLEAMASGLPIITTDTGGTSELISGNGMIIRKNSPSDIARAAAALLGDSGMHGTYAKKSREIALSLGWDKVAEEYYLLYKNELEKTPHQAA